MDRGDKILAWSLTVIVGGIVAMSAFPLMEGRDWWTEIKSAGGLIGGVATFVSVFSIIGLEYWRRRNDRAETIRHCRHVAIHCLNDQTMQLSATVRQFVIFLNDKGYLNAAGMVPRHRFASFARSAIHNLEMEDLVSVKDKVYFVGPNADVQVRKFNVMRQAVQRALDGTLATAENEEGAQFFVERVIQMAERVSNLLNFAAQAAEALRVESEQDYIEQIQMIKSNSVETKHCIDAAKSKVGLTE